MRICCFIIIMALAVCPAGAQIKKGTALFEHLNMENGLSSNQVNCIFEDSRGFIWIGTRTGLNRYDGVEVLKYFHDDSHNSIAGNSITSIQEDRLHRLWIGTREGVSCFDPETNRFLNYLDKPADFEKLQAREFYVGSTRDGNTWVSSNFYVSFFNNKTHAFTHYKIDNGEQLPITRNHYIHSVFEDSKQRLWIPTSCGVQLLNRNTGRFTVFRFPEHEQAAPENAVVSIRETVTGKIIAATWGGSILIFNETSGRFEKMILYEEPMAHKNLINIVLDIMPVQNQVYCATSEGLVVLDEADLVPGICSRFTFYSHNEGNNKSLSSNIVNALLADRTGTLWVASKGISRLDPLKQQFSNHYLARNNTALNVACAASAGNRLVLGADDAYFFDEGELKPAGLTPRIAGSNGSRQVWDLHAGKKYLWLGTTNGLIQATRQGIFVKQYTHRKNDPASIAGERIWKVYEDSKGLVWMATVRRGISILDPANGKIINYFSKQDTALSLFNKYISDFFEDGQGNIWFTAGGGWLYCYNRAQDHFSANRLQLPAGTSISSEPVIIQHHPGSLVLVSQQGILLYNIATQKLQVLANDAAMNSVSSAVQDQNGNYWMITASGLLYYSPQTAAFKQYSTQNGLLSGEDMNTIKQVPGGGLLVTGMGFMSSFMPSSLGTNRHVPPVYITQVLANSKDTLYGNHVHALPHLSGIEFRFTALNFSDAAQNMYQYRLKGINDDWSKPTTQRSISYAQLPPGDYIFEVKGSNAAGTWNNKPAVFSFSIQRPFYKTWWFMALAALALGLLLYLLYRYRLKKAIELEKMRTRIATDLHDDIGATLSSISMYSDALKGQVKDTLPHLEPVLEKMGQSSRDMVTGMSDIVWAINPANDSGEKLLNRMESYATDMCALKNIALHFTYDQSLRQVALPLTMRKNVYLIFKEAVNNAVKYSGATILNVNISFDSKLTLQVTDDGNGFNEATARQGNGLKNFQLRAAEIHAVFQLKTSPGNGTHMVLTCAL